MADLLVRKGQIIVCGHQEKGNLFLAFHRSHILSTSSIDRLPTSSILSLIVLRCDGRGKDDVLFSAMPALRFPRCRRIPLWRPDSIRADGYSRIPRQQFAGPPMGALVPLVGLPALVRGSEECADQ